MTDSKPHSKIRHWQELASSDFDTIAADDPVAVMVLAAIEQHGPHLPLSTDLDIGLGLLDRVCRELGDDFPLLILPPLAVGASEEHQLFPGTLSLSPGVATNVICGLGESVARAGVRRLILLNSHGGNTSVMTSAALHLRRCREMLVVKASYMKLGLPEGLVPVDELRHGLHGGLVETAMMMHLEPARVRENSIQDFVPAGKRMADDGFSLAPEGEASYAWLAGDLHPSGVAGKASDATAGLGKQLVEHYARGLADVFRDARRLDPPWFRKKGPGR